MFPYNSPPPAVGPQGVGAPALNPLAAALLQGGQPGPQNPYGPPPGQGGLPLTGGAAPGSIPLGAPTNQFGNPPAVPIGNSPLGALSGARPPGAGVGAGAALPFGFGGYRPPGY